MTVAENLILGLQNRLEVSLSNISTLAVDGSRAALGDCGALDVNSTSDGAASLTTTGLSRLVGGALTLDGKSIGAFSGVLSIPAGQHSFRITPAISCGKAAGTGAAVSGLANASATAAGSGRTAVAATTARLRGGRNLLAGRLRWEAAALLLAALAWIGLAACALLRLGNVAATLRASGRGTTAE